MKLDKKVPEYLKQLVVNNNREWFHDNKAIYTEAKALHEEFVAAQIEAIAEFDKDIKGLQDKDCTFRIHRDVRFSHDKTPYKIHFGSYIAKGGRKSPFAGYYTHIEPDGSFIAGGLHLPSNDVLKDIRLRILENPLEFKNLIEDKQFKSTFSEIYGEKLKTAPKGFDRNFKHIDLLRYKSFDFLKKISDEALIEDNFFEESMASFKLIKPLNDYFNQLIK
jgi:uncharacterized protein (TIGR02453 family)